MSEANERTDVLQERTERRDAFEQSVRSRTEDLIQHAEYIPVHNLERTHFDREFVDFPTDFDEKKSNDKVQVLKLTPNGVPGKQITITRWQMPEGEGPRIENGAYYTRILVEQVSENGIRKENTGVMDIKIPPESSEQSFSAISKKITGRMPGVTNEVRLNIDNDLSFDILMESLETLDLDLDTVQESFENDLSSRQVDYQHELRAQMTDLFSDAGSEQHQTAA